MNDLVQRLRQIRLRLSKYKWLPHILVGILYLLSTFYYMGPSVTHCSTTLYGFGDNTAGPIWRYNVSPDSPLWGYQDMTNYPYGEDLYSPVNYSGTLQYTWFWALAKVAGPVCGYNLMNITGFVVSALVMYGFVFAITKRRWIAILAGYAVSFTPYYQMKVGGHPSYGYQALIIGLVWAFYNLVKKRRKRDAIYLALIFSANIYFDPYFMLLACTVVAALGVAWLLVTALQIRSGSKDYRKDVIQQLKLFGLSVGAIIILLMPMFYIAVTKMSEINSSVAAVRGNVLFEARACSNLPHEYALPFALHYVLNKVVGGHGFRDYIDKMAGGFTCGLGEDSVGISLVVLTVTMTGMIVIIWELINRRRVKFKTLYDKKLLVIGLILIAFFAVMMALPPLKIGNTIPTPSYLLIAITSTWRTLARFYVLVNFATIALFALILTYYADHFKKFGKALKIILAVIFLILIFEYQAFKPFGGNGISTFDYSKEVSPVYLWLKDRKDIQAVAEYPLERLGSESGAMVYYLTMQVHHGKKLFNGHNADSNDEIRKASLKDLSDGMTIDTLYSLGVDTVIIHGIEEAAVRTIPGLEVIGVFPPSRFNLAYITPTVKKDIAIVAKLKGNKTDRMLAFDDKFVRNTNIIRSAIDWEYEVVNGAKMSVVSITGRERIDDRKNDYCFSLRMSGDDDRATLKLIVDGKMVEESQITPAYKKIKVSAAHDIILENSAGFNMQLKDLGCGE